MVSFCTGGIRCEKAALLMREAGAGRTCCSSKAASCKYFEEAGGAHFDGDCFVFDERGTLNDTLVPVPTP